MRFVVDAQLAPALKRGHAALDVDRALRNKLLTTEWLPDTSAKRTEFTSMLIARGTCPFSNSAALRTSRATVLVLPRRASYSSTPMRFTFVAGAAAGSSAPQPGTPTRSAATSMTKVRLFISIGDCVRKIASPPFQIKP